MNLIKRCQKVWQATYHSTRTSFRCLAKKINLSKSSIHRLYHRILNRNQYPESQLWETEPGQQWLRLLVLATIFVFSLQGGIGCERISQFFHLLRLQRHIAVSPTALRSLRAQMESTIIDYQKQQHESIKEISSHIQVCAAADETFFDQVILVMLDLPSGYIFLEHITENYQYETWLQQINLNFKKFPFKVKYLVSDRAKEIIKLALNDLGAYSIADLFHVLRDLNLSIAWELNYLTHCLQKQIQTASLTQQPKILQQLQASSKILKQSTLIYQDCCHSISTSLHPFHIHKNTPQTTQIVSTNLKTILTTLSSLKTNHKLKDRRNSIKKFKNQIQSLSAIVDIWWSWVDQCLATSGHKLTTLNWVKNHLLPTVYWQQKIKHTKNPSFRKDYQTAYLKALQLLEQHPITLSLSPSNKESWWHWAVWMVSKFQRSSSPIEGRNGYLSQIHHSHRGLSNKRLQVSTVIHNFYIKRSDGTTAAQRLFGRQFPNLFDYLIKNIPDLPQPRKSRKPHCIIRTACPCSVP